jgi:hypothetical protein
MRSITFFLRADSRGEFALFSFSQPATRSWIPNERRWGAEVKAMPDTQAGLGPDNPPLLLAILIAARRSGDRRLESLARRELEQRHRIKVSFASEKGVTPCGR